MSKDYSGCFYDVQGSLNCPDKDVTTTKVIEKYLDNWPNAGKKTRAGNIFISTQASKMSHDGTGLVGPVRY